ncbi:MAG: MFS transporter [Acidobacteria bacterium]|nr:MAG: MFS transporter [Acidobacteriota bacterium]
MASSDAEQAGRQDALFTPRFFTLFAFTFTVFVSMFQLLPTAPYRILAIGGSTAVAGLFLGLLTYASALSAPLSGSIVDRLGQRRVLIVTSLVIAGFSTLYAVTTDYRIMLGLVVLHGIFWSGLLTASGAYMAAILPPSRRAEGLGYWGFASIFAIGVAPSLGFVVYHFGWFTMCFEMVALNLLMAFIAWRLPELPAHTASEGRAPFDLIEHVQQFHQHVEWRVVLLSITMSLVAFGYGALTSFSALFADWLGVTPRGLFLIAMAVTMLGGRLLIGRAIDRIGHRRVLLPSLVACAVGMAVTAVAHGPVVLALGGGLFGLGFGLMWPAFAALALGLSGPARSGAAYGAMIAAFDTGIGTGSSALGSIVAKFGYRPAFGFAAVLAALAAPYFLLVEKRFTR